MVDFSILPDDVFLASYPRSGNTWTRFLIGNLRHVSPTTFVSAKQRVPDVYGATDSELLSASRPRILKIHEPAGPAYRRAIYLVRHPERVAPSFWRYLRMMHECPPETSLEEFVARFVEGDVPWGSWSDHVTGWLERPRDEVLLVRYEDLVRNPACELCRMAEFLGLMASEAAIGRAVARSERQRMMALEDRARTLQFGPWARADPAIRFVSSEPSEPPAFVRRAVRQAWEPTLALLGYT